jgi:hypothetical protein
MVNGWTPHTPNQFTRLLDPMPFLLPFRVQGDMRYGSDPSLLSWDMILLPGYTCLSRN